jgi:hypothetical protein
MSEQEKESLGLSPYDAARLAAGFQRSIISTLVDYRRALLANKLSKIGTSALDVQRQVEFDAAFFNHVAELLEPHLKRWGEWRGLTCDAEDLLDIINDSPGG